MRRVLPHCLLPLAATAAFAQARPGPRAAPLPAIPAVRGPLTLQVVYPADGQGIAVLDSTFLFGSTGSGSATLTVNGVPVPVAPNGAFLAWVAVPADSVAVMRFVATEGGDSAVRELRLPRPDRPARPDTGAWLDRRSLRPAGTWWAEPGDEIRVSVVAAPGANVVLQLPGGEVVPLAPDTGTTFFHGPFERTPPLRAPAASRYVGVFAARNLGADPGPVTAAGVTAAPADSAGSAWVVVAAGAGTARSMLPLRLRLLDPARRAGVLLDDDTARMRNTDDAVAGTAEPGGTYHWFFPNGTQARVSGRRDNLLRLRLSAGALAWVDVSNVAAALAPGLLPSATSLGLVRLEPGPASVRARFALGARVPVRVDEDGRTLSVRVYGATANMDFVQYGPTDGLIERIRWDQATADEVTVQFDLAAPVFGWRAAWEGSHLVLEIRRPPAINRQRPLRGRVIAIDPGHPPGGATGPTGLREAEANFAIAQALRRLLVAAGARVVMARDADTAIGLYERVKAAEAGDAEILVSIHNNAFPDGVNPWENNGTSTYYYHPRAVRLAALVQQGMLRRLGLRDLGIGRADLALARPTWLPAVLTEGAFLMIPEQEHALRTPAFQEKYARGVMEGIEAYLREMAR